MVKTILKETKNKEVLAQAIVLANTLIVDTFDGKQFKSANWDKVKTLDKLEEWPFTVEINERRYPWGILKWRLGLSIGTKVLPILV